MCISSSCNFFLFLCLLLSYITHTHTHRIKGWILSVVMWGSSVASIGAGAPSILPPSRTPLLQAARDLRTLLKEKQHMRSGYNASACMSGVCVCAVSCRIVVLVCMWIVDCCAAVLCMWDVVMWLCSVAACSFRAVVVCVLLSVLIGCLHARE